MKWVQTVFLLLCLLPVDAVAGEFLAKQLRHNRVLSAYQAKAKSVEADFHRANAQWPPSNLLMRNFKLEGRLELWSASKKDKRILVKVRTFPVCAHSGVLGPKLQSGDRQVPEGIYYINRFNPRSSYHLSLGLNYPNGVDKHRSQGLDPGGDIFVHGDCVTIGCLPLRDGPMEELYIAAISARDNGQKRISAHMFPCRFGTHACGAALDRQGTNHAKLWRTLRTVDSLFNEKRQIPWVRVHPKGSYTVRGQALASPSRLTRSRAQLLFP